MTADEIAHESAASNFVSGRLKVATETGQGVPKAIDAVFIQPREEHSNRSRTDREQNGHCLWPIRILFGRD
jgi:hypothetical protein